jgi:hypothetical protein
MLSVTPRRMKHPPAVLRIKSFACGVTSGPNRNAQTLKIVDNRLRCAAADRPEGVYPLLMRCKAPRPRDFYLHVFELA